MKPHERLEEEFAGALREWGATVDWHVVACSSGTAALHLALEALRLPSWSKVLVPDYTMVACPRAVVLAGLEPVFVDCLNDLTTNPIDLEKKSRTGDVAAAMPVHVYGRKCVREVFDIADDRRLAVVEDMAEAHGLAPDPRSAAACWSFYRNKTISGEEGGAVAFREPEIAKLARSLRSLGFTEDHDYRHVPRGHNYRMSDCHAKAILFSLHRRAELFAKRIDDVARLDAICPEEWRMPYRPYPWVYDLRIPGMDRPTQNRLVETIRREGIPIRHGFYPLHLQDEFCYGSGAKCPNAERIYPEVIYVPLSTTTAQMDRVVHVARELRR